MRTLFIALLMTTSLFINAQQMEDKLNIQETISKMFINSDNQNWTEVEAQFAPKVTLDYSSMTGNLAEKVSPTDITTGWKTILPGFTYTHHQIGNFITKINGNKANSFCYGTATHYLEDDNGNVWTVVGSYDFDLEKVDDSWKITSMTFNYKYQNGNSKLIENAIKNVKNN
ncbi:nuclear transport factor 2 family protein [Pontimicrobium sp. IMCC45349]|uniref:nuclear transport factor 2 family protein n=1 Tax=Pontimicrobium sp. IMCC45349 TaxID=3391574 RepID=UPI0039A2046F